jgi:hypothetical protein
VRDPESLSRLRRKLQNHTYVIERSMMIALAIFGGIFVFAFLVFQITKT